MFSMASTMIPTTLDASVPLPHPAIRLLSPAGTYSLLYRFSLQSRSDDPNTKTTWKIFAVEDTPGKVLVDFSPKGGPSNLLGILLLVDSYCVHWNRGI